MKNYNSHLQELNKVRHSVPRLRYTGDISLDEWRIVAKNELISLLGLPLEKGNAGLEIEYQRECEGYTDCRFTVESEPGYYVPCHLLIPASDKEKYPLTICFSGHGAGMHIAVGIAKNEDDNNVLMTSPELALAIRSVNEGRAALVIESRGFGECSINGYGTSCTETAKTALLMGRTFAGERVHDAICVLDAVIDRFMIDEDGIIATGFSGGGTTAYYFACIDDRIKLCAPSCSICTFEDSIIAMPHCLCNHIPGIRREFEMCDLAGLIAPRSLIVAAGEEDPIFPIGPTIECFEIIKKMYVISGAPSNCELLIGDGGHTYYADLLWREIHKFGY